MALLIPNDVTERVLDMDASFAAIEDAFVQLGEDRAAFNPRIDIWSPTATEGDVHNYAALIGSIADPPRLALRFRSDVMQWVEREGVITGEKFNVEPGTFMGFVLLYDTSDGALIGLLNDGVLQHHRVGANAGVAAKYLAREDASTVGMIGSGGMARTYAKAFAIARDLTGMSVYSPTPDNREAYAAEMREALGIDVEAVESPAEAVAGADIVATCTNAEGAVYETDWLEPGQFVIDTIVGEIPEETYERADSVYTNDTRGYSEQHFGLDLADLPRDPRSYERQGDYPTLPEVATGRVPGREREDETIFYRNNSSGIQFAAICSLVHERADARGLGTEVPLSWFQQDIQD